MLVNPGTSGTPSSPVPVPAPNRIATTPAAAASGRCEPQVTVLPETFTFGSAPGLAP